MCHDRLTYSVPSTAYLERLPKRGEINLSLAADSGAGHLFLTVFPIPIIAIEKAHPLNDLNKKRRRTQL